MNGQFQFERLGVRGTEIEIDPTSYPPYVVDVIKEITILRAKRHCKIQSLNNNLERLKANLLACTLPQDAASSFVKSFSLLRDEEVKQLALKNETNRLLASFQQKHDEAIALLETPGDELAARLQSISIEANITMDISIGTMSKLSKILDYSIKCKQNEFLYKQHCDRVKTEQKKLLADQLAEVKLANEAKAELKRRDDSLARLATYTATFERTRPSLPRYSSADLMDDAGNPGPPDPRPNEGTLDGALDELQEENELLKAEMLDLRNAVARLELAGKKPKHATPATPPPPTSKPKQKGKKAGNPTPNPRAKNEKGKGQPPNLQGKKGQKRKREERDHTSNERTPNSRERKK
jgi:hypothetical protein